MCEPSTGLGVELTAYKREGFLKWGGFFTPDEVRTIRHEAQAVFTRQMARAGIKPPDLDDDHDFLRGMSQLFERDLEAFIYCGKTAQHLMSLHRLALSQRIEGLVRGVGLSSPVVCTRPVLFFNHPQLAKKAVYHTVFTHQDWRSMQGSLDSVVVWVPLMDISPEEGALRILPGSHRDGLVTVGMEDGFGRVELSGAQRDALVTVEVKAGDVLLFSSFLIHESGDNTSPRIRWSCHFRYNNIDEPTFIGRKFYHPYNYGPRPELYTEGFPQVEQVQSLFSGG